MDEDGETQRRHQSRLLHWRERWQRGGPFALVSELCAVQAERLLGLLDGERRLTNYLQLGEQLQEAAAHTLGLHGLLDWLQARMADADADDETQLLRLKSDALRVHIVTLHKSKGVEYPLVYLPFAGLGTSRPDSGRHRVVHDGTQRVQQWKLDKDDLAWKPAGDAARREAVAEDARLLYVGLTLGTKYSSAMNATFLDAAGKPQFLEMGWYGIGITRLPAAAIEQNHDERGIIWPDALAPFTGVVCPIGPDRSPEVKAAAERLYVQLLASGIEALLDDRGERPGAMFADWELIGIPHRVTIGDRGLKEGLVEYQHRRDVSATKVALDGIGEFVTNRLGR